MKPEDALRTGSAADLLAQTDHYQSLKGRLHRYLIRCVEEDEFPLRAEEPERLRGYLEGKVFGYITEQRLAVNRREVAQLVQEMLDEMIGLGPIQPLVDDPGVNDVLVNGPRRVFVERGGVLRLTDVRFVDDAHVLRVIQRILAPLGRRIDESTPMVDARLADGSRVNAIIPPVTLGGPCLSIRKFRAQPLLADELVAGGTLSPEMRALLERAVGARANVLISGATGAGKTTLLNALSQWIGRAERVVTIEDTAELRLEHDHVVALETRPPNLEGQREITARDLVRNALRMRPDRIVLGEIRSVEVLDLLQAMNTGHDGSLSTVHANSPRDALFRLELLSGFAGYAGSERTLREMIASAIDLLVQVVRGVDGQRRVQSVQAVNGLGADAGYALVTLYAYDDQEDRFVSHLASGASELRAPRLRFLGQP
jgi:pilus assembly protein CpaF